MNSRPAVYEFAETLITESESAENKLDRETALGGEQSGSPVITYARTDGADHSDHEIPELAEVLILPAVPLPPLVHVGKLAEVALLMLEGGRVEPAKGVLRAVLKVLGRAPASGSVQAVPVPSTCSSK